VLNHLRQQKEEALARLEEAHLQAARLKEIVRQREVALEKVRRTVATDTEKMSAAKERDVTARQRLVEDIAALRDRNMTLRKELSIGEQTVAESRAAVAASLAKLEDALQTR